MHLKMPLFGFVPVTLPPAIGYYPMSSLKILQINQKAFKLDVSKSLKPTLKRTPFNSSRRFLLYWVIGNSN